MRWGVSVSLLVAGLVGDVFAGVHHYHAHRHRHHLIQHGTKLESRDATEHNVQDIPEDVVVESTTMTTTTTVYGKCMPTKTVFTTLDIFTTKTQQAQVTPEHEHPQPLWNQFGAKTESTSTLSQIPEPEPTSTTFITRTIHKTATNTVVVTEYPEDNPTPLPHTPPGPSEKIALANTLPKDTTSEEKAMPEKQPPPKPTQPNGDPIHAVLDLPGQVLPEIPVVNQIFPGQKPKPHPPTPVDWTATAKGDFSFKGFGGRTPGSGKEIHYHGNTGKPWGSNIKMIEEYEAHRYKYVTRFRGSNEKPWTVIVWNKFGPDGKMDGWYGHSAVTFTLPPGETRYVAFDEDSEGAWGAAPGEHLPKDKWGGYSSTWGEFSFGDGENNGWSGWDVSAIQAQIAKQDVQGMSICQADGKGCSIITPGAKRVVDAYTESIKHKDGIGGAAPPGPVRLDVLLDYRG